MSFLSDTRGSIAIAFGLAIPVMAIVAGLAVDYAASSGQHRKLQAIADIAALTAAKELYLANADSSQITSVANTMAQAQLVVSNTKGSPISVSASVINDGDAVEVVITQDPTTYFAKVFVDSMDPLSARSVARALGGGRICVLALEAEASQAVSMIQKAKLEAVDCAVYSNSTSSGGIFVDGSTELTAELICSAGGINGSSSHFNKEPTSDCPTIEDPLSGRPAPTYGGCDYNDMRIEDQSLTLSPGVYCGGLTIRKWSEVTFEPGIYVIKDGEFRVDTNAAITGNNVGFYLTGNNTNFHFWSNSRIVLSAPADGPMAGILFFEDRSSVALVRHYIKSNEARILIGTFYLSQGILDVSTSRPVADLSAWTAIIARRLDLSVQPRLVLNADYGSTDVPVPTGVSRVGGSVVLVK